MNFTEEIIQLKKSNRQLSEELRSCKLAYIQSMRGYMQHRIAYYRNLYNDPIETPKNVSEATVISELQTVWKDSFTITLSGTSAFLLKKIKSEDPLSFTHGVPVEFIAHCDTAFPVTKDSSGLIVTDAYKSMNVLLPYHEPSFIRSFPGKYLLISALLTGGSFYGMEVAVLT